MLVDGYERVACYARYVIAYYLYLVVSGRIGPFQTFSIRFSGFMVYILYQQCGFCGECYVGMLCGSSHGYKRAEYEFVGLYLV